MTKKLLFAATAALAISSCTTQEVDDVATTPREPIRFEQFVGKATRAGDVTTESLKSFRLLGKKYTSDGQSEDIDTWVVNNRGAWTTEPKVMYWEKDAKYCFAAFYTEVNEVVNYLKMFKFESKSETDYGLYADIDLDMSAISPHQDIVAAICPDPIVGKASGNDPISFNFKHILTKVLFTFTNGYEEECEVKIVEFDLRTIYKGEFALKSGEEQGTWNLKGNCQNDPINNIIFNQPGETKTITYFTLPQQLQSEEYGLNVMLDLIVTVENNEQPNSYRIYLSTDEVNQWEAGHVYNYKLTIKPKPEAVQFEVAVEDWGNAEDADLEDVEISEN